MVQNWVFAADLLASKVSGELPALFVRAQDARPNWSTTTRTVEEHMLDAHPIEVISQQSQPLLC